MPVNQKAFEALKAALGPAQVALVAVSKTKPATEIRELYDLGQLDFGENYVQELVSKQPLLPSEIRWHFIGHLQSNKVKFIAPFVHLIHGVDSSKLLREIDKQAQKAGRIIRCLLQVHIATEESKFGFDEEELSLLMQELQNNQSVLSHVNVCGLMGMASFSNDEALVRKEFSHLKSIFDRYANEEFNILSMGMSGDYRIAISEGSNMVRIGSLLFGSR